jgi:hypothetical protein
MNNECSDHVILVPTPTPDNSVCLNFSVLNDILLGADGSCHGFVAASTFPIIDDDMAEGAAVHVLERNRKIIKPGFFIFPTNRAVLIKGAGKCQVSCRATLADREHETQRHRYKAANSFHEMILHLDQDATRVLGRHRERFLVPTPSEAVPATFIDQQKDIHGITRN